LKTPYREQYCPNCPFKGIVSESTIGTGIRYIDCQRDNEDTKENFKRTSSIKEMFTWVDQDFNFKNCLYDDDSREK
jgi:hypothetical protein